MKTKTYNKFKDKYNNQYGFDNYMDFSKWWFNLPQRYIMQSFEDGTRKKLQYAAEKSKEAKIKMY